MEDGDWVETKDQGGSDYRLLQVSNIGHGEFRETGNYRYVTEETFMRLRCQELQVDDVLVARMPDPVGRAWHIRHLDEPAITAVDVAILRPDMSCMEPAFLAAYINSPFNLALAEAQSSGTTRSRITRRELIQFPVPVPPLDEQRLIVRVLGSFDDLIQNNRRRIETLEEMARLLYREWFVHFRFPGHEDVEMVDSELGPIPAGWEVAVTSDLIARNGLEIGDGYRAKNAEMTGGPLLFLRVKNVQEGYFADLGAADSFPVEYLEVAGAKCSAPGDIAIAMKGSVGRLARVDASTPPLVYSPQVSYWRVGAVSRLTPTFLYHWMRGPSFVRQCAQVKGSTDMADYVNLSDQRRMRLLLPSTDAMQVFGEIADPQLELAANLRQQNRVLREARDLLLPRLVSGELDVSELDLERIIE